MKRRSTTLLAVAFAVAGCTQDEAIAPASAEAAAASVLHDPGGRTIATATATASDDRVRIRVEAAGLGPGTYGVHVHNVGRCEPPDFASAGPHWNPAGRQHGSQNPQGPHMGDLPNLTVGTDGRGSLEFTIAGAGLRNGARPMLDGDGASLMIHASPDDYRTDPSGNSGARIACGLFG